jgi:hypothetical protein
MAGTGEPALQLKGSGTIIGYSRSAGKVISGENEVMVRGLKSSDDLQAWVLNGTRGGEAPVDLALTYARIMLAQGKPDRWFSEDRMRSKFLDCLRAYDATDAMALFDSLRVMDQPVQLGDKTAWVSRLKACVRSVP